MNLIDYLNKAVSPYHVVASLEEELKSKGYKPASISQIKVLDEGKYFINIFDTSLVAFELKAGAKGIHMASAHTDYPCFKLKPEPKMAAAGNCQRVNVEPYGGMLKRTWFDRPLGMAGVVYSKGEDAMHPIKAMVNVQKPLFIIPGLAPHMDREIEKGDINVQKEIVPIYALGEESEIISVIADAASCKAEDILSFDLDLNFCQEPVLAGANGEFIMAQGIDNIASVAAITNAILEEKDRDYISIACYFNNEEIGSSTKQGADSGVLSMIFDELKKNPLCETIRNDNCFFISADGAHALHPNYPEKADPTSKVLLGKGLVVKTSASQRYATDAKMTAIIKGMCHENGIDMQVQANKSGAPGGSTLGPIISSHIPMLAADMGIPMLAMHSSYETAACADYEAFERFMKLFL